MTWALALSAVVTTSQAFAVTDQERWAAHQELTQAQDLKKKGDLDGALAHYEESARLDPKLATLTELAELEEQLGRLADARTHWAAARDKATQSGAPNAKQRAEERLAALEKRFAHLTLAPARDLPSGAQVYRDDALVEREALGAPTELAPGNHVIVVKAPEHQDAKYEVKLGDGEAQTLPIAAGPSTAPPPPPPPQPAAPPKPIVHDAELSSSGSSRRTLGLVAAGAGVVAVGVGIPLWYVGYRDGNSLGPTANQQLLAGQIAVIGGGALLATGLVLFATAPSAPAQTGGLRIVPALAVGANSTVVGASGRF